MISAKIAKAMYRKSKLLNLADLGIEEVPKSVAKIKSLEILNLGKNKIKELRPLGELPNLKVIYLDSNQIKSIHPEFFDTVNLNVLNLSGNQIQNIPENISSQKKLRRLFLSENKISFLSEFILELESLEYFDLAYNQLTFISASINKLKNLQSFSAYNNQISEIKIDFTDLKKLTHLNLAMNSITELPTSLRKSKSLKSLQAYSNEINIFPNLKDAQLSHCDLNLGDNKIEKIALENGKLNYLHLYFNPLFGNQFELVKRAEVNHLYIDESQTKKFTHNDQTMKCIEVINNKKLEINLNIYKTIPKSIEKKYGLISRSHQLRKRIDNWKRDKGLDT